MNGADINIVRDDFEGNVVGNFKMLYGSPYTVSQNYFEQQGSNPPSYNVQVGDTTIPPQGFTPTPGAIDIDGNFMQCNLTQYPPAPIVVETSQVLDIERNSFSQCGHENIVDDTAASATAHITLLGNISDAQPLAWLTHTTGVVESDVDTIGAGENPGTPFFYGLGIDSQSGASTLAFNNSGANVWNLTATAPAFSFVNGGANTLQIAPFGAQTHPSVLSNYAMASAEVIVTQSGNSATFDAGLGNTFELIMNANVTSASLVNAQPGEWLDFIICQGGGGPWTFAWPSNVFGGGTVGITAGDCSTQQFYVSGSNAWAAGPMLANLTSGSAGPSLLGVSGTVPYFTSPWTLDGCLEAGGSPGLITILSSPCGSGGGGGTPGGANTAVQFNNSGVFGGDATNFFYNSTSHNLTITGAMTTAANSFALAQLVNPGATGDLMCGNASKQWADCVPGIQQRSVTGTTDTIASSDRGNMVTYSGSSAVAVTLPSASSFGNNFFFHVEATGSGLPAFTPSSGTINGASTFTPPQGSFGTIYSPDNVNYTADFTYQTTAFSAGTCTLSSGSCSHTFTLAYAITPVCTATDTTSAAAVKIAPTRTAITITGTGSDAIAWTCMPSGN